MNVPYGTPTTIFSDLLTVGLWLGLPLESLKDPPEYDIALANKLLSQALEALIYNTHLHTRTHTYTLTHTHIHVLNGTLIEIPCISKWLRWRDIDAHECTMYRTIITCIYTDKQSGLLLYIYI